MRICIFSANYLPNIGGIERYTYYTSKELVKRGHDVTIVTSNLFSLPSKEITEDGVKIFRYDCHSFIGGRFPVFKRNDLQKEIDREVLASKPDLIIVNARFYFHSLHAMKMAKKHNIRCICIEHGTTHLTVNNRFLDYLGGHFEHFLTALDKRYCKEYYGVSKAACEWSGHFGIESKGTLYNSIDVDEINEMLKNPVADYRKELNLSEDTTVISYTGRMIPEKGVDALLYAFSKLENKDCALILAGDGPLFDEIKEKNIKGVYQLGKIDFEHVIALLKATDIFCLASRSEGFSTAVLEAVAARCYVITTKTGGTKELISGDGYGTLMDTNEDEEVAKALNDAVNSPEKRQEAVNNAYLRLIDNFTWIKTVDKLIDIIKENEQK
ncbi:MAG: glycosyltransferase family 4 protein [Clostridia bacterium]|nr:glycosyltransferase family 4 protein [Clostridia bacterium]